MGGGGAGEKLLPRKSRWRKGGGVGGGGEGMKNHFRNLVLPPESRTGCKNSPNPATQGARRRRLPRMRDMPPQCVPGDFRRSASEIRSPWFDAP